MVDFGQFFRFENGCLTPVSDGAEVVMAAADSFLVNEGRVRSLQAHYARFASWVEKAAPQLKTQLAPFFEQVSAALPRTGRWFPRIELRLNGILATVLEDHETGKAAASGVLAMPIIPGEPMKVQYRDIRLKRR